MLNIIHCENSKSIIDILSSQWVANILTFLGILAAIFLGFIAIFRGKVRAWFIKPKFKIDFELKAPYCHKVPWGAGHTIKHNSYYLRVKVENSGNYQMEDVEVMVADIKQKKESENYEKLEYFIPLYLNWAHYNVRAWKKIQPHLYKYFSLGYIVQSDIDDLKPFIIRQSSEVIFMLDTKPKPFSGEQILYPNTHYEITLEISANHLKMKTVKFQLWIKDEWTEDEKVMFEENISCGLK